MKKKKGEKEDSLLQYRYLYAVQNHCICYLVFLIATRQKSI